MKFVVFVICAGQVCIFLQTLFFLYVCVSSSLYKQRVLVKAQLGENIELDMLKFTEYGEVDCAMMWHCVAFSTRDTQQKMSCYQNAISELQVRNHEI